MSVLDSNKEFRVSRYTADDRPNWDAFIHESTNGTFLFNRSFMDYHCDRFRDNSYLIWEKSQLFAVFVAGVAVKAEDQTVLVAHPGLTYGGLVHNAGIKYYELEKVYDLVLRTAREEGFSKLVLKPVARVFCRISTEAQDFYFYKNHFVPVSRDINSVVDLTAEVQLTRARKKNLRKAESLGLRIKPSSDCSQFYQIMTDSLHKTHGVTPVHTLVELQLLMAANPESIRHYVALLGEQVVGGTLLFLDHLRGFVHTQYTHANEAGRDARAIDALVMNTVSEARTLGLTKLSFGISTLRSELNYGLLSQKEDFGSKIELMSVYEKQL